MKAKLSYITIFFSCFILLSFFSETLSAQAFGVKQYNVNNGLPSTECYETYQDNNNYLWIGTGSGISRFDGRQFINYGLTDGLPSLIISAIFQDSKGRLWVGTNAGMAQFVNNKFVSYPMSDSLPIFYVFGFVEKRDKQLLVLTDKGVYTFTNKVWQKIKLYPGLENHACRGMIETNDELYINYDSILVCKTKDSSWLKISAQQEDVSFFKDMVFEHGTIYVSSYHKIFEISHHYFISLYKDTRHSFTTFLIDKQQRLWLPGDSCVRISKPGDWQHSEDSISNLNSFVSRIQEDADSNVWICSGAGLYKIKASALTSVSFTQHFFSGAYRVVPLPGDGLIFSSSRGEGFFIYRDNNCKPIPPPASPAKFTYYKDIIDASTFDDKNVLWMITRFRKLLNFDGDKLHDFTPYLHLTTTEFIYDISYVKRRKQFFICADSTLLYGSDTSFTTFIPRNTGVPIVKPTRVLELSNSLLLLYIDRQGVFYIDSANNLISLKMQTKIDGDRQGIQLGVIIHEDREGNLWVAVPGFGLYQYHFGEDKIPVLQNHYTSNDGLQSNHIFSMTSDWQGRLWVASSVGLDILQKNKSVRWEVFNYANAEDLSIPNFDFAKLVTNASGMVWLSSTNKIIPFNTNAVQLHKKAPKIIIEKVSLLFKETDWKSIADSVYSYYQLPYHPELKWDQNSLAISFDAVAFSSSHSSPDYSYQLLPLDTNWSLPSKTKSVSFAQLPAGQYQFKVRARDEASQWSEPAIFQFSIAPPFWDKWWFRLLIIALATYIIVNIFKARIKKIRREAAINNQLKELEMKALKAQMNPHFIYNALNSIQALIANNKTKEGIHYIGSFSRLLRQVLDHSDNNVISLDKELETIGLYVQLEALRLDMQLSYRQIIPDTIVAEFEKIPPLILQPFVENALWHGLSSKEGNKEVTIAAEIKNNWLVCNITDNGIGRKKAQEEKLGSITLHQSKGIEITRKRLIDFNDDATVPPIEFCDLYDNDNPSGTRVVVHIKRNRS